MTKINYGISGLSMIPLRKDPSEKSEMLSQILFGETFVIHELFMGWCLITLDFDDLQGWVDQKMITPLNDRLYARVRKSPSAICSDIFNLVPVENNQNMMIVAGSTLPCWRPYKREFSIGDEVYSLKGKYTYHSPDHLRSFIIQQALLYYNVPYLWGGRSPMGIDCSGFSQIVYKIAGISLPRYAAQQVALGSVRNFVEEAAPGDLAFFDDEEGKIVHVGILWESNKIIHVSGKVRIDNVDQYGIFNADTGCYTHRMRVMKTILPE